MRPATGRQAAKAKGAEVEESGQGRERRGGMVSGGSLNAEQAC